MTGRSESFKASIHLTTTLEELSKRGSTNWLQPKSQ
ncbi:hypothetical protein FHT28_006889 [Rhizobium sp. SG570]|nr:hypothetical protein [Rhizobium sp. SG570]